MAKILEAVEGALGKPSAWLVCGLVVSAICVGGPNAYQAIKGDGQNDAHDQPPPPPAPSSLDPTEAAPQEPQPEPPAGARDPGAIDKLLAFLLDDGRYPAQSIEFVAVPIPPNGPDDVAVVIEQVQATNRALVPDTDPSMVNAATSCAAAEQWRQEGDWGEVIEQLGAKRFDDANFTCVGITLHIAQNAPPSGTSYVNVPELVPRG